MKPGRIALLDRDGTLIEHIPYLNDYKLVQLLPGVVEGLKSLKSMGFALVMVSNQSGLGRGYFTEVQLKAVHDTMEEQLAQNGIKLDRLLFCPHHPKENCHCRKPEIGLAEQASAELELPLTGGIVVGDASCDMGLAKNLGWPGFLLPDSSAHLPKGAPPVWQDAEIYQPGYREILRLTDVPEFVA